MDAIDSKSVQADFAAVHSFTEPAERICGAHGRMAEFAVPVRPIAADTQSHLPDSVRQFGSNATDLSAQTKRLANRGAQAIRTGDNRNEKAIKNDTERSERHTVEHERQSANRL